MPPKDMPVVDGDNLMLDVIPVMNTNGSNILPIPEKGKVVELRYFDVSPPATPTNRADSVGFTRPNNSVNDEQHLDLLARIFLPANKERHVNELYLNKPYLTEYVPYDDRIDKSLKFLRFDIDNLKKLLTVLKDKESIIFRFIMRRGYEEHSILTLFSYGDDQYTMSHGQTAYGKEGAMGHCMAAGAIRFTRVGDVVSIASLSHKSGHFMCADRSLLLPFRMILTHFKDYINNDISILGINTEHALASLSRVDLESRLAALNIQDKVTFITSRLTMERANKAVQYLHYSQIIDGLIRDARVLAQQIGYPITEELGAVQNYDMVTVFHISDLKIQSLQLIELIAKGKAFFGTLTLDFLLHHIDGLEQAITECTMAESMQDVFDAQMQQPTVSPQDQIEISFFQKVARPSSLGFFSIPLIGQMQNNNRQGSVIHDPSPGCKK
ncbi:hypothetical protein [uncultured Legionella sp.]|uniref:hypothetical protein n=1 Tax=uncultured Legionella sp. TaxID=210934 RepID=UPI002608A0B5|nr:hypothetical protein [uncultured Legionella sp.]